MQAEGYRLGLFQLQTQVLLVDQLDVDLNQNILVYCRLERSDLEHSRVSEVIAPFDFQLPQIENLELVELNLCVLGFDLEQVGTHFLRLEHNRLVKETLVVVYAK